MADEQLVDALMDLAGDHDLVRVTGAYRSARDEWTTVTVREAGAMDDLAAWPDGWVVETEVTSL